MSVAAVLLREGTGGVDVLAAHGRDPSTRHGGDGARMDRAEEAGADDADADHAASW
jgi:hypothetical protein